MQKEAELEEAKKNKAFNVSIKEGTSMTFANDLGNSLITPLITEVGGNSIHIASLSGLAGFLSPLFQIRGDRLMEKNSRKKIVSKYVLIQSLMWLPIALIGLLYTKNILVGILPWILIAFYLILTISGSFTTPAWFSWLGDLVKDEERGKKFARRNIFLGLTSVTVLLIGGFLLKYFRANGFLFEGFTFLFVIATIFSLIAYKFIKKQYEPKFKQDKKSYFSIWAFLKRYDNFGKFAVYQAFFNFAVMIASPFFAFYMLDKLGYRENYFWYMIVNLSSTAFYLLFMPLSGKFSDKYGNLKLLWIANIGFALTPILWLFVRSPLQIIFIPNLCSGLANAALGIAVANYTYDSVSKEKRGICIAYTNILIGTGTLLGSLIGGVIIKFVNSSAINSFFIVFILAAVARLLVAIIFLPQLKEVKKVSKIRLNLPIHMHLTQARKFLHLEYTLLGFNHHHNKKAKTKL